MQIYQLILIKINFLNNISGVVGGHWCVGKKTTLLQTEVSACVSEFANVLFCGWDFSSHYAAKLPLSLVFFACA